MILSDFSAALHNLLTLEVEILVSHITYDGQPAAQLIVQDITTRKKAEASLREQNRILPT